MTGQEAFDPEFYQQLVPCIEQFDPKLMESVNAQWTGFKTFASTGGNPSENDVWKRCDNRLQVNSKLILQK